MNIHSVDSLIFYLNCIVDHSTIRALSRDVIMNSTDFKAAGSNPEEYLKKMVLKDSLSYGPWKAQLTSFLDAEDC